MIVLHFPTAVFPLLLFFTMVMLIICSCLLLGDGAAVMQRRSVLDDNSEGSLSFPHIVLETLETASFSSTGQQLSAAAEKMLLGKRKHLDRGFGNDRTGGRGRRSTGGTGQRHLDLSETPLTLDLAVFVDHQLMDYYLNDLDFALTTDTTPEEAIVYCLFETIIEANRLLRALEHPVSIRVVHLEAVILHPIPDDPRGLGLPGCFGNLQFHRRAELKEDWDHAVLFTGHSLTQTISSIFWYSTTISVGGYSSMSSVCRPNNFSFSLVDCRHMHLPQILAHELGHSMGMDHDGTANDCSPLLMGPSAMDEGPSEWSECSQKEWHAYLASISQLEQGKKKNCLQKSSRPAPPVAASDDELMLGLVSPIHPLGRFLKNPKGYKCV